MERWSKRFTPDDDRMFAGYNSKSARVTSLQQHFEAKWGMTVPRHVITHRAHVLGYPLRKPGLINNGKCWKQEDLDYLADNYGLLPTQTLARHLKRTKIALLLATKRRLGIHMKMNFITAQEVGRIFNVSCAKVITDTWVGKGFLESRRLETKQGSSNFWCFTEENLVAMLRRYPWLPKAEPPAFRQINHPYYRNIVYQEWEKDPWYTAIQVARIIGWATTTPVEKYIREGSLACEKRPGGPWQGANIIRCSSILNFLADDPRRFHFQRGIISRLGTRLRRGLPVQLYITWLIVCPVCRKRVIVRAPAKLHGPDLALVFADKYQDCSHGAGVDLCDYNKLEKLT